MNKTVKNAKNSLKFKAQPKTGILEVRVGVKKYSVPVEARMLSNDGYLFLSFSASSELFKIDGKKLTAMSSEDDATAAMAALTPTKRRGRKRGGGADLTPELETALKGIPSGFRLGYGPDNQPRLVRTRQRRG
jgi:hypothetical protein